MIGTPSEIFHRKYLVPLQEGQSQPPYFQHFYYSSLRGHCGRAMFALCETRLRSFTICKQACIVLAGTNFATTETLVSQRSTCKPLGEQGRRSSRHLWNIIFPLYRTHVKLVWHLTIYCGLNINY